LSTLPLLVVEVVELEELLLEDVLELLLEVLEELEVLLDEELEVPLLEEELELLLELEVVLEEPPLIEPVEAVRVTRSSLAPSSRLSPRSV
jgi:hypothetical protein